MRSPIFKLLLISLVLVGCTNTSVLNNNTSDINIENILELLSNEDYEQILELSDDNLKAVLTVDALDNIFSKYSKPYEIIDIKTQDIDNDHVNTISIKQDGFTLVLTISLSNTNIIGLYYKEITDLVESDTIIEEELDIGSDTYPIIGRIMKPNNQKEYPLVIIVGGSGPTGMDGTVGAINTYHKLANELANNNIASIRYDKRTKNYQPLTLDNLLDFEYIEDLEYIIDYANTLEEVNEVILLGHSQGGMVIPYLVSYNNIDKMILMNSTPKEFEDLIYTQNLESLETLEIDDKETTLLYIEDEYQKAKHAVDDNESLAFTLPLSYYNDLHIVTDDKYLLDNNLPTLVCNGLKDFQVNNDNGSKAYKDLLDNKDNYIFKTYDNLNHLMTLSDIQTLEDYNTNKELDKEFINDIVEFIKK